MAKQDVPGYEPWYHLLPFYILTNVWLYLVALRAGRRARRGCPSANLGSFNNIVLLLFVCLYKACLVIYKFYYLGPPETLHLAN